MQNSSNTPLNNNIIMELNPLRSTPLDIEILLA